MLDLRMGHGLRASFPVGNECQEKGHLVLGGLIPVSVWLS